LCPSCSEETTPSPATARTVQKLGQALTRVFTGRGCGKCRQTGFSGRTGLYEMLVPSDEFRDAVTAGATLNDLRNLARQSGMRALLEDGFEKIREGKTTVEEVLCVAGATT